MIHAILEKLVLTNSTSIKSVTQCVLKALTQIEALVSAYLAVLHASSVLAQTMDNVYLALNRTATK